MSRPTKSVDWERVARAFVHPWKAAVLDELAKADGRPMSPKELGIATGVELSNISHHVTTLAAHGLIELVETQPVRGVVEHFYRLAEIPNA